MNMNKREAKDVEQIHQLLTTPVGGVDSTDEIEENLNKLVKKLSRKNWHPLNFVIEDLDLAVRNNPNGSSTTKALKKDLAAALV
jgi:hypothetical protein